MPQSLTSPTPTPRLTTHGLLCLAVVAVLATTVACSGDGGGDPTAPAASPLVLAAASVRIDGQPVANGQTFHHGRGAGAGSTFFEARLERDGIPAPGETVFCDFDLPGMGNMHDQGRFGLYDDGTHGDPVAGDGIYCLEDFAGQFGFHHMGASNGQYRYDLFGQHHDGGQTNHRVIQITVAD